MNKFLTSKQEKMSKVVMMAFGGGQDTTVEVGGFKKYIGVGVCNVVAVNPTKAQIEQIYGSAPEKDPEYIGKSPDDKDQIRIDFILKTVPEKNNGIEAISKVSFFVKKAIRNSATGKVQVVNKYGEFGWIEESMAKKGEIPENTPWYIGPYRPAMDGEENLTHFVKTYLGIPTRAWKDANGKEHFVEDLATAEAQLEDIQKYFTGNVKELVDLIALQKDNTIKADFGIKSTDDGKEYQDIYTRKFIRGNARNNSTLDADITKAQAAGAYPKTVFSSAPLKEYTVEATAFANTSGTAPTPASLDEWFVSSN